MRPSKLSHDSFGCVTSFISTFLKNWKILGLSHLRPPFIFSQKPLLTSCSYSPPSEMFVSQVFFFLPYLLEDFFLTFFSLSFKVIIHGILLNYRRQEEQLLLLFQDPSIDCPEGLRIHQHVDNAPEVERDMRALLRANRRGLCDILRRRGRGNVKLIDFFFS